MTMDDAEQIMMPFFPYDINLASRALSRSMTEQEGTLLPDWIWEAVAQQYFMYAFMQQMEMRQKHMRDKLSANDPFKIHTIPLMIMERPSLN